MQSIRICRVQGGDHETRGDYWHRVIGIGALRQFGHRSRSERLQDVSEAVSFRSGRSNWSDQSHSSRRDQGCRRGNPNRRRRSNGLQFGRRSASLPYPVHQDVLDHHLARCRTRCLDGGTVITEAEIQAGLKMYNVTLRDGDAVFLHTGWGALFMQFPAENATYAKSAPGIGKAAAAWLAGQRVVLVGTDTWVVEVIPSEDTMEAFPVHAILLTDNAIHIVENVRTDLTAAAPASSKRATFFLSMTVPKAVGTTGTFVNIEAIR